MNPIIATIARSSTRNLMRPAKRTAWKHALAKLLMLCALTIPKAHAVAFDEPIEHDIGLFEHMQSVPDVVDAAAIFNNPAEQLMLSPVGKGLRTLLAFGGIFPQTEHAWQALADAFDDDVDDTIRALLSRRVAVVWSGLTPANQNNGLAEAIDSQWTLVCEVDPSFLNDIAKSLKPAKRNIVHSRAVYAIEQGRYHIALIAPIHEGEPATVLLSPRSGSSLLHAVLSHLANPKLATQPATSPITSPHEPMLAELTTLYQNTAHAQDWSLAFVTRMDIFFTLFGWPINSNQHNTPTNTIAGIVKLDQSQLACTFVTNTPIDPSTPDAPIELFDAIQPGAAFTVATSQSPQLLITNESLSFTMSAATNPQTQTTPVESIFNAPAAITISNGDDADAIITACFVHASAPTTQTVRAADEAIHQIIKSFDPAQAPNFQARFPSTPRQIDLRIPNGDNTWDWPGTNPKFAWLTTKTRSNDLVITSMGSKPTNPTAHIKQLEQAALTLDALDAPKRTGVLFRLNMNPERTLRLFAQATLTDLMLAKLVHEIDIDIRRGIDAPIRGQVTLDLTEFASKPKLGSQLNDN